MKKLLYIFLLLAGSLLSQVSRQITVSNSLTSTGSNFASNGYLIIIAGQSNGTDYFTMSGNISADIQGVNPNCYTFYKSNTALWNTTAGSWVQMQPGVNTNLGTQAAGKFGIGLIIANRLKSTYGKRAFVVPTAISNTYLDISIANTWNVAKTPVTSNWYYNSVVNFFKMAYPYVNGLNLTPVLIWDQGENDCGASDYGAAYSANETALINAFRADTGFPNLKVIITQIRSDYNGGAGGNPGLNGVRAGKVNSAATLPGVYLYDTGTSRTPLSPDAIHYNPQSASYLGTMSIVNMGEDLADLISTY